MPEGIEKKPRKSYTIDLSGGWDSVSHAEIFIEKMKSLPIYRPDLLYCGISADDIGKKTSSTHGEDIVFCSTEAQLTGGQDMTEQSALEYALDYDRPAIAVYDSSKMTEMGRLHEYQIKDKKALVAIITIKM